MPRTAEPAKLLPSLLGARTVAAATRCMLDPRRFPGHRANASAGPAPIASLVAALGLGKRHAPRAKRALVGEGMGILVEKGGATSVGFRPSYWFYFPQPEGAER